MTTTYEDLTIDDLLGDPMTQAIMQADRVDPSELKAMLRALAPLVAHAVAQSKDGGLDVEGSPSDRNAFPRFLRCGGGETARPVATRSSTRPQFCSVR
jgi:hypothetical protein